MTKKKDPKDLKPPAGGAPTLYKLEYVEQIIEHFKVEPYNLVVMESSTEYHPDKSIKIQREKKQMVPNKMPTLFNFSQKIGVTYVTVWRWAHGKDDRTGEMLYPEFCNAYKAAKELQKEFLIGLGLSGSAPASAYIFTAKNISDMRDNVEVTNTFNFSLTSLFDQAQARRKQMEEAENK